MLRARYTILLLSVVYSSLWSASTQHTGLTDPALAHLTLEDCFETRMVTAPGEKRCYAIGAFKVWQDMHPMGDTFMPYHRLNVAVAIVSGLDQTFVNNVAQQVRFLSMPVPDGEEIMRKAAIRRVIGADTKGIAMARHIDLSAGVCTIPDGLPFEAVIPAGLRPLWQEVTDYCVTPDLTYLEPFLEHLAETVESAGVGHEAPILIPRWQMLQTYYRNFVPPRQTVPHAYGSTVSSYSTFGDPTWKSSEIISPFASDSGLQFLNSLAGNNGNSELTE